MGLVAALVQRFSESQFQAIRGLTVTNAGWQPLRTQLSGTWYGLLTIEFRPSVN